MQINDQIVVNRAANYQDAVRSSSTDIGKKMEESR